MAKIKTVGADGYVQFFDCLTHQLDLTGVVPTAAPPTVVNGITDEEKERIRLSALPGDGTGGNLKR